jgi:hypothetical protein
MRGRSIQRDRFLHLSGSGIEQREITDAGDGWTLAADARAPKHRVFCFGSATTSPVRTGQTSTPSKARRQPHSMVSHRAGSDKTLKLKTR